MKTFERSLFALIAALLLLPSVQSSAQGDRYKVAACDWMMLKRQKLGEFELASRVGLDGVELDMGSLGNREMFDSQLRDTASQERFLAESARYDMPVCAVAMSGFYAQDFAVRRTWRELVEDCLNTCGLFGAKVAYLPLGGVKGDWKKSGIDRDVLCSRLHEAGEMAAARGMVIGIRTTLDAGADRKLLRKIDSKGILIDYSVQDAVEQGLDLCRDIRKLGAKNICQIHISNTDGVTLRNDTQVDMDAIKATLDAMGWSGWLVIERSRNADDVRNVVGNYSDNATYLKQIFQ